MTSRSELARNPRGRSTLKHVAALAGVDPSAVSRVVNNQPSSSVSEQTRARILAAVQELNYQPNIMARGLRVSRTWTLGFVLPDLGNPMYQYIVRGACTRAEEAGYGIVLGSQVEGVTQQTFATMLEQGRVEGLLMASGTLHDDFIRQVADGGQAPVVIVNRRVEGVSAYAILDDAAGSYKATRYLIDQGHRRIAALIGPPTIDTSARRRTGFHRAVGEADGDAFVVDAESWGLQAGYAAARTILTERPDVTGIFASTVLMGLGALRAARELSRPVPESLSVISLHDSELLDYVEPPLTTVAMPSEELGARAVDLLLARINGDDVDPVVVPGDGDLVERASVAPPAEGR